MTERDALLKAVCDHPDDDTPRLVFADWLQENGDETRAEFIRLQVRREREVITDRDEWARVVSREFALEKTYGPRWRAELPTGNPVQLEWSPFERGFAGEMLTIDREIASTSRPGTRWQVITDLSGLDWGHIYQSVPFTRVRFVSLAAWHAPLAHLGARRLKSVCLVQCAFNDDSLRVLTSWERHGGELRIHRDDFPLEYDEKLLDIFGTRYQRNTAYGA